MAGAWAVMQVELMTRTVGHASLGLIAAGTGCRPRCCSRSSTGWSRRATSAATAPLPPHRGRAARGRHDHGAWAKWLNDQLEKDRGRPQSAELRVAADAIAKRLLAEDLTQELSPADTAGASRVPAPA